MSGSLGSLYTVFQESRKMCQELSQNFLALAGYDRL